MNKLARMPMGQLQNHQGLDRENNTRPNVEQALIALRTLLSQDDIYLLNDQLAGKDNDEKATIALMWYDWLEAEVVARNCEDDWARRSCSPNGLLTVWANQSKADLLRERIMMVAEMETG